MIDINMDYDLKKENTISETFGTVVSMAILFKDKGFSDEEIMTTLSVFLGFDLKPVENIVIVMKCMIDLYGDYDNFIKHLIPLANQARSNTEKGEKNG